MNTDRLSEYDVERIVALFKDKGRIFPTTVEFSDEPIEIGLDSAIACCDVEESFGGCVSCIIYLYDRSLGTLLHELVHASETHNTETHDLSFYKTLVDFFEIYLKEFN